MAKAKRRAQMAKAPSKKKTLASKDARKAHGATKKGDFFWVDPELLNLVTDTHSDIYVPDVGKPPPESMIRNFMEFGCTESVTVRRNRETGKYDVFKGRTRVMALREVNKRRIAKGEQPYLIKCIVERTARGLRAIGMIISENNIRKVESPSVRAEQAARMIDHGGTHEDVAVAMGIEVAQVKNLLTLFDAPDFIREAVDSEAVTFTNGVKAAVLAKKEGPEAGRQLVKQLIEEAPRTPGKKRSANSRKAQEIVTGKPGTPSKKEMRAEYERAREAQDERSKIASAVLAWVLGETETIVWPGTGSMAVPISKAV